MKRKILTFSNKISKDLYKPDKEFTADMTYSILASKSCLLTDIVDQLHEDAKKVNSVERLSRHLEKGASTQAASSYLQMIKKWVSKEPVIHIDDSDVVKPDGCKFESLGIVRDGSESSSSKSVYKKGYYDDNKMFLKLDGLEQDYVIRLTSKRKLLYHNKWTPATKLRDRRKGKIKTSVFYRGKDHEAYLSHVKVQITASRKDIYLFLVYGITEHPMMLATNKGIRSGEPCKRKGFLLLLPAGQKHLRYTLICKRGLLALVSDETSQIPAALS